MKIHTLLATACALLLSTPAQANIFNWLAPQKTKIDCAPLDRTCLIEETVDMVFSNAAKREGAQNTATKARQLSDLAAMMPQTQADALRQRIVDANDDPSFLENFDRSQERHTAPAQMPLETLRSILETCLLYTSPSPRD